MHSKDKRPKEVQGYRYEVADSAKRYVEQVRTLGGHSPELCYGKKVEDIVRFTEPSAAMGMTVSQVPYTWRLVDIADWARNPGIEKQFYTEQFLNSANQPQSLLHSQMTVGAFRAPSEISSSKGERC